MLVPNPRIVEIFDILDILEQNFKDRGIYDEYELQLQRIYITHVLRRAADVSMWLRLPVSQRQTIINKLVNIIELKYADTNVTATYDEIIPFNPVSNYFLKHHGLNLLDKNMRTDTDESKIKKDIVKILK